MGFFYTEKNLFYSCSLIVAPYVKHGEQIKKTSVNISYTDLMTSTTVTLKDDKYGNLRDHRIDSASFVKNTLPLKSNTCPGPYSVYI